MSNEYSRFFHAFYLRTEGFIPAKPLNQAIYPGDFFQIRNGEMLVLGNVFQKGILGREDCEWGYRNRLNPGNWHFSSGVTKPYSGRDIGEGAIDGPLEFSKQVLAFDGKGSFYFRGNQPESVRILNWFDLQQSLIIKLTQTRYSFRELYFVTESATTADWTLAISGAEKAELEIATEEKNFGLVDIFGQPGVKTIRSMELAYYHREPTRKPVFFRAKKLAVQERKAAVFIDEMHHQWEDKKEWARGFYENAFEMDTGYSPPFSSHAHASLLDMLPTNELNPNTALDYFHWVDASLDDIEKLFLHYGN